MDSKEILDFEKMSEEITLRSTKAQCTFLYVLIHKLGPSLCRAVIRYATQRLDTLNSQLPDDNPHKQFYLKLKRERTSRNQKKEPRFPLPTEVRDKY